MIAHVLSRFVHKGWMNLIGGCCGTHAEHTRALVELAAKGKPRNLAPPHRSSLSGIDYLEITDEVRPVLVGERTNVIGSRKFKTLICENKFEEASEIARSQIKNGAQIVDICLANPDRNELEDMRSFLEFAVKKIRVPFMIDSTDPQVIELALSHCQGKAVINSINLGEGEARFEKIVPLAKKYGAAVIVGTIDDDPHQGMATTRQRKLEIAKRSYELLTQKYGILPHDIYWDPLVFPCATPNAPSSAEETIEGIRLLKQHFPKTKTILGISNVSFGLPPAGREVLNSVFLDHCVQAGLDLAIVNAERLQRSASISELERKLAEALLYHRPKESSDPVAVFVGHFRNRKASAKTQSEKLPLLERLPRYIIEGSKNGLVEDLGEALKTMKPLEIINGPLMSGMDEVGRLFNTNKLIVAEVLQSAEAMKTAVGHLEPFMEKTENSSRGKILLASVKGDVHDIGKNLVEIILANNGFEVVNLGIKVPPEQIIQAVRKHRPDIVGLSGLLVKSAHQMVTTAEDLSKAGISTPVLVGGAALSSNFVDKQIATAYTTGLVAYAQDAMSGLDLAKIIVNPERFEKLKEELQQKRSKLQAQLAPPPAPALPQVTKRSAQISVLTEVPQPPDLDRHLLRNTAIEQIWNFINPLMLYGRHLGIRGSSVKLLEKAIHDPSLRKEVEEKDPKALKIWESVKEVQEEYRGTEIMKPAAIYQFFRAASDGNQLFLYDSQKLEQGPLSPPLCRITFQRQKKSEGLCLADYSLPLDRPFHDTIALFIVTVGKGVRPLAEHLKNRGDYLKSHIVQALALESAEAYAEMIHSQIRKSWGFPDPPEMTLLERFQAKYRGKRYSFGYPACPRLDDQATLWKLLNPADIGVQLTDGFMMDPEASVSALVFHHSQASYFSVGHQIGENGYDDNR
jgi:5-methyltetrahydrofolate--homocysteine methyltransferase